MIKNLLRLLAASASFVAVILVANLAIAAPSPDNSSLKTLDRSSVDLNVVSPSLKFAHQDNTIFNHLGCTCTVCVSGVNSSSSAI